MAASEEEQKSLGQDYLVLRAEVVQCLTERWNHPYDEDRPFVWDYGDLEGTCEVCGAVVDYERMEPHSSSLMTCIAVPHTRLLRWFEIDADTLYNLVDYLNTY